MSDPQYFICVHGHFYQPPRENAWLETVEVQDSAAPYHDWNERIDRECYAANGSARILSPDGRIARIVNNYSRISFNFGPTLLSWMEKEAPITYRRVLEGDRASMEQFGGHGSAIAQVYNHVIMPLATTEDRIIQIRWGIADFEQRFQRKPEGMWLAETAVDLETLDLLAQHGILFTILAPHQCARVRAIPVESDPEAPPWQETPEASVDPTQPYLVHTAGGRSIAVFFYDGPISRAIAFNGLLNDGHQLAEQLLHGFRDNGRPGQLVHVATDGESYGHHHPHGDMALASAIHFVERNGGAQLTNYGQFLEMFPPTYEAEIRENTSWSCSHGVERWRADCGCGRTGAPGSNQQWRAPLRNALDGLRDSAQPLIRDSASKWLRGGEAGLQSAIHAYISVLLDRTTDAQQSFLDAFAKRPYAVEDQVNTLKLMELERHLQLMYTSCGWFFDDLAGIEPVQVISYAGRALELAEQLFGAPGTDLASAFLARMSEAHANGPEHMTGEEIYLQSVTSKAAELKQACARYAIVSLFEPPPEKTTQYCYEIRRKSFEILTSGRGRFAYGQAEICSRITWECGWFDFAVLHLGDQNLSAAVRPTGMDGNSFAAFAEEIRGAVTQADLPEAMRLFRRDFGSIGYSLSSLIRDDQRRILQILLDSTLAKMTGALRAIYEDHVSLLRYLSLTRVPKPNALILAAQYTLNADLCKALGSVPFDAFRVRQLLAQTLADQLALDARLLSSEASERMLRAMIDFEQHLSPNGMEEAIEILETIRELPLDVDLWEAQNIWHSIFRRKKPGKRTGFESDRRFRELGEKLGMDIERLCAEN